MSSIYNASTPAEMEKVCAKLASLNDPRLVLMRAAADGRIGFAYAFKPDTAWPFEAAQHLTRPTVFLVGDDPAPEGRAVGPRRWAVAKPLRAWAPAVIVHGAGGRAEHYREAVFAAEYMGRCAMIETDSSFAHAWADFFRCPRTLLILPTDGAHPTNNEEMRH